MRTALVVAAGLLVLVAIAVGARLALAPKPFAASFTVVAEHGYDVDEAERNIALPIERALAGLDGVASLKTHVDAREVTVRGELKPGLPADAAIAEVFNRVSKADLMVLPSVVYERAPILRSYLSLETDTLPAGALDELAEKRVRLELLHQPGMRDVEVCGPGMTGTTVELDPARLTALGLAPRDVLERIRSVSLGMHGTGSSAGFVVRGAGPTRDDLRAIDLGSSRRLEDVAVIRDEPIGPPCWAHRQGRPSIGVLVKYVAEADLKVFGTLASGLPAGVRLKQMRVDRVIEFGGDSPPQMLTKQVDDMLRDDKSVADCAVEVRPLGKGSVAVAFVELNDPKAKLSLHSKEPQMVHVEGQPLVQLTVAGPDPEAVARAAQAIEKQLGADFASTVAPRLAEVRIEPDRARLADLGIPVAEFRETLELSGDGVEVSGGMNPTRVKLPNLADEDLATLRLGKGTPLAVVAKMVREATPTWIDREDGLRVVRFQTAASLAVVQDALKANVQLPAGVVVRTESVP
jgi:multidrug efflux pump subunit AcrB